MLSLQSVQSATGLGTKGLTFEVAQRVAAGVYEYSTGYLVKGGWAVGAVNFAVWDGATQVGTGALAWGNGS